MKKVLKYFILVLFLITLTGCNKKNNEKSSLDVLNDVLNNKDIVDSLKIDMIIGLKVNDKGTSIDSNVTLSSSIVKVDDKYNILFDLKDNPLVPGGMQVYGTLDKENVNVYFSSKIYNLILGLENGKEVWIKEVLNNSYVDDISDMENVNIKEDLTENDFYLVSRSENKAVYCFVISNDLLKRMDEDENSLKENVKIYLTIDEENKRIINVSIDLMELLNNLNVEYDSLTEYKDKFEKFTLDLNVSYEDVSVVIPSDVISSAISIEEYLGI